MIQILVVEDEAITALDIKQRLKGLGYSVPAIANTGEEAISFAESFKPDLVLMDIILKGEMDGTQAAKYISSHYQIPIIFLTAFIDEDTFKRAKLSDPYSYITKPFETRDLQIAIELALFKHDMITTRQKAENDLIYLSQHDVLTGLYNRFAFEKEIQKELDKLAVKKTLLGVLLIDLDNFKTVNNNFGHHIGDQLLTVIANELLASVTDQFFIARLGGDEFAIIHPNVKAVEDLSSLAERLINLFNKPFKIEGHYFHSTASIGIATIDSLEAGKYELMKHADLALYSAKELGRANYQFFSDKISEKFKKHSIIESELPAALIKNQFYLVYQPQYSLPSKVVSGIEVLIRWKHPGLGLIMPDDFIVIGEKNGLIVQIGEWVLRQACSQFMEWRASLSIPDDFRISVNLSPRQLEDKHFMNKLASILKDTGILPQYLELELTETAVMTSGVDLDPILNELKDSGIKLSIDDFGMGYSSLSRLKTLPINTLKIDKSFMGKLLSI